MSKNTHTPGPWIVVSGQVETPEGIAIARMDRELGNGTLPVERDCNAYLCAAAPELLTALEAIEKALRADSRQKDITGDTVEYHLDGQTMGYAIGLARNAIQLARKND